MKQRLRAFTAAGVSPTIAILAAAALAALAAPAVLAAQDVKDRDQLLVDVAWLETHYQDADIVLIHFGPEEDYAKGHIPGAVGLTFQDISSPHDHDDSTSLMLEMPDDATLEQLLRDIGVNGDSRVIVYWSSEWITPTSRMMLTLDYVGLGRQSAMLDGGLEAWAEAGLPVTEEPSEPAPGTLSIATHSDLIVTAAWVEEHAGTPGIALVDARSAAFYDGVKESDAGEGHIPGALNIDWRLLVDGEPAMWRSAEDIATIFEEAGVKPGDTVVGYCHVGQYATAMLFAARTLGYDVRLYDGSMQDWGGIREFPLAKTKSDYQAEGEGAGR